MTYHKIDYIFDKRYFEDELSHYHISNEIIDKKMKIVSKLITRLNWSEKLKFKEKNVEQSYFENIFCRLFDYKTQFVRKLKKIHIVPQLSNSYFERRGPSGLKIADYVIGHDESNHKFLPKIAIELKINGTELLEKNNSDKYVSPVDQAFQYASDIDTVDWFLVTNMTEYYLFFKKEYYAGKVFYFDFNDERYKDKNSLKRILFVMSMGGIFVENKNTISRIEKIWRRYIT